VIVTGLGLITGALKELGVLALGQTPSGAEQDDMLESLNQLGDALGLDRLLLYACTRTTHNLTALADSYTIGATGQIAIERPDFIDDAALIQDTGADTPVERGLGVLDRHQYAAWPMKTQQQPYPQAIYYDKALVGSLTSLVYVLPIPTATTAQLVLYTPGGLLAAFDLSTNVIVPRGWARMLRKNLALELAPQFPQITPSRLLMSQAADSLRKIHDATVSIPMQKTDPALMRGQGAQWDIDSGSWVRR
jgi:hypothetical protein